MSGSPSVSVIGAGGWGTALALLTASRSGPVRIWGHDPGHVADMVSTRANAKYLPGIPLPETIVPTTDLGECLEAEVVFVAVPSRYLFAVAGEMAAKADGRKPILVSCTKGIELSRGLLMSEVIADRFPDATPAVLSGPNLAGEIAKGIPAAAVIGCMEEASRRRVQTLFAGSALRAYTSGDVRGIQLGGALKNVFAIGAGISDGLGLGENAKAALVTRSLAEMKRLGVAMGGARETFGGLSGIGDLMVTCFSERSRNRGVGVRLGCGEPVQDITASTPTVAEGIPTAASALAAAERLGVETPIIGAVQAVISGTKTPPEAMRELMGRQLRSEEEY